MHSRILLYGIGVLLAVGSWWAAHVLTRVDFESRKSDLKRLAEFYRATAFERNSRSREPVPFPSVQAKLRTSNGWLVPLEPVELAELKTASMDPYAELWEPSIVLLALAGYRDEASKAVNEFVGARAETTNLRPEELRWRLWRKAYAVELLGITATKQDLYLLRRSITIEGARELTKDWIDQVSTTSLSEYEILSLVQGCAGRGLAYAGTERSHAELEKTYNEFRQKVELIDSERPHSEIQDYEQEVYGKLADAMALRDFVQQLTPGQAIYVLYCGDQFREIVQMFGKPYSADYWVIH